MHIVISTEGDDLKFSRRLSDAIVGPEEVENGRSTGQSVEYPLLHSTVDSLQHVYEVAVEYGVGQSVCK